MSVIDKVVAAVTPPESDEARHEATAKSRAAATSGDWLSIALQHHEMIRTAFRTVKNAQDADSQNAAQLNLKTVLMGHAIAEEAVLYPALALAGEKGHAGMGYTEQAAVKIQMMALDNLPRLSQEHRDKLEHIEGAVLHHMYEEEGTWFLELKEKGSHQDQLTALFQEEFDRYTGRKAPF